MGYGRNHVFSGVLYPLLQTSAAARQQFSRRRRRHTPRTPQRAHSPPLKAAKSTRPPWAKISRPRIGVYLASCVKAAGTAERSRVPAEGGRYPSDKTKSTDFKSMLSFLERLTRLELATSTLARWRSTR